MIRNAVLLTLLIFLLPSFVSAQNADLIFIEKAKRQMTIFRGTIKLAQYAVALGGAPRGPKRCQGDKRTPEGDYVIRARNPRSAYHRSLEVSYPNNLDKEHAKKIGCNPGSKIMIHGLPNGRGWFGAIHRVIDWTLGCVAVRDSEIEEIWNMVADGTRVRIVP